MNVLLKKILLFCLFGASIKFCSSQQIQFANTWFSTGDHSDGTKRLSDEPKRLSDHPKRLSGQSKRLSDEPKRLSGEPKRLQA